MDDQIPVAINPHVLFDGVIREGRLTVWFLRGQRQHKFSLGTFKPGTGHIYRMGPECVVNWSFKRLSPNVMLSRYNDSYFIFLQSVSCKNSSRDSSVGITTGHGLDGPARLPTVQDFPTVHSFQTDTGPTQPPIQWVPGSLSPEVKRQGRQVDHSRLIPRSRKVDLYLYSPYAFIPQCVTN
jgi:hypothetical protein